jgi:hypothetical protein
MYADVPARSLWLALAATPSCGEAPPPMAMPKSMMIGAASPSTSRTSTLDGLRSRWMMPFWCACWTPWQMRSNSTMRALRSRPCSRQ